MSQWFSAGLMALACLAAGAHRRDLAAAEPSDVLAARVEAWDRWCATTGEPVPDFTAMKSSADLPPLLRFADGRTVKTRADWEGRKAELRLLLCRWIIGSFPEKIPPLVKSELIAEETLTHARRRLVKLTYKTGTPTAEHVTITAELLIPDGKGSLPVFMTQTNHRRVGLIGLSRGYLVCIYPARTPMIKPTASPKPIPRPIGGALHAAPGSAAECWTTW